MTSKKTKNMDSIGKGLLDEQQKYKTNQNQYQMIEMKELSKKYDYINLDQAQPPRKVTNVKKQSAQNPIKVQKSPTLNQKQIKNINLKSQSIKNNRPQNSENPSKINQQPPYPNQNYQYQSQYQIYPNNPINPYIQPIYMQYQPPRSSYVVSNPNITVISLNGMSYQNNIPNNQQFINNQPKKSSIPDMVINCIYCRTPQNTIGTSRQFICYRCHRKNQCYPLYNIIRCYSCSTQVCYRFGTSHLIRCVKCNNVNKVLASFEEVIHYQSSKMHQKQKISLPKDKQEQEIIRLDEQQIQIGQKQGESVNLLQNQNQKKQ